LGHGHPEYLHPAKTVADQEHGLVPDRTQDGREVVAERERRQVAAGGAGAPAGGGEVEQDASVPVGQAGPLVVPGRHVEAEPVDEHDRRLGGVAGGANGQLGPVERSHRSEIIRRELGQVFVGLGVRPASRVQHRASDHAARHRAGGDAGGPQGGALAAHRGRPCSPPYSGGPRSPIPVVIWPGIVPARWASSSTGMRSSPWAPSNTTSSPGATDASPQSTRIWSIVIVPAPGWRRPPIRTSAFPWSCLGYPSS